MGDKDDAGRSRPRDLQAQALARETGITFEQALELIQLIGPDRSSLLREARILKNQKPGCEP